ncbi:MAG TPA: response regulator transcription factor [Chitinophagaceae bacterium]|nr:response regulator transcription factor [Chitinophagaceae bacterium]
MHFTIALAEDNSVNRNTFIQKIKALQGIDIVFVATDGNDCLEQLKGLPQPKLPQVIFMDLEMPGMDGIEAIRMAKSLYEGIHFIVLTIFDDDEKIFEAIQAGASGYLLKHEPAAVLQEAIINVLEFGGAPMSPAIARKTLRLLSSSAPVSGQEIAGNFPQSITEREKEILRYMINGWDAKRIGSELAISVLTIRKHIANIYQKLHVNSKAQVISLAHKNKWV